MYRLWSTGKSGDRGCINSGNIRAVRVIDKLRKVSVLLAVLNSHVLMLMVIVFLHLAETYSAESADVERTMIPAPEKPVKSVYKVDTEPRIVFLTDLFDISGKRA